MQTGSTYLVSLHDGHSQARRRAIEGCGIARRASADHYNIELLSHLLHTLVGTDRRLAAPGASAREFFPLDSRSRFQCFASGDSPDQNETVNAPSSDAQPARSTDAQTAQVEEALERLIAAHDPITTDVVAFRGARYDAGLAWVHFPVGFGGLGVRPELNKMVERRLRHAGAAPQDPTTFFMALAGPTIVTHGDDAQRARFLRPMFTGEERWCQLFSEPGAGSDFAGLACKAVQDGDEWVVNGQKVWNTMAHLGDWGMLVTRTDPEAPKHKGMTYFAVDMHSPGVEVRPLRQITGEAEFNEVYLTEARIPDANRIGATGEGWRVALTTLMNERTAIGGGAGEGQAKAVWGGAAREAVKVWDEVASHAKSPAAKDQLMKLWVRGEVGRLTNLRASEAAKVGNPGPEGSVAKPTRS
jgi:alkylation response protein AidB-like acyl-CoA dehydrogenase